MNESPQFEQALARLRSLAGPDVKPIGTRIRAEIRYGQEYQKLVRQGLKPQLRQKYRLHA